MHTMFYGRWVLFAGLLKWLREQFAKLPGGRLRMGSNPIPRAMKTMLPVFVKTWRRLSLIL